MPLADQPRWHLLSLVLRLLHQQHSLLDSCYHGNIPLRLPLPIRRTREGDCQIHWKANSFHHQVFSGEQNTDRVAGLQLPHRHLLASNHCIIEFFMFEKYSLFFYLLGWGISTYPSILSYVYFRSKWSRKEDLRLTFHTIHHPPTYL